MNIEDSMYKEFSTNTNLIVFNKEQKVRDMDELIPIYASYGIKNLDLNFCEMMRCDSRLNKQNAKDYIERLKDLRTEYDLAYIGSHAPYERKGESEEETTRKILKAIEYAEYLDLPYIVVHPKGNSTEENIKYYEYLASQSDDILIAIENMETDSEIARSKDILEIIKSNPKRLKALFDTGHANILALDLKSEIRELKGVLVGLHIHDNNALKDQHLLPFMGNINWKEVISALEEIEYPGYLTYEAMGYSKQFPVSEEEKVIEDALLSFTRLFS